MTTPQRRKLWEHQDYQCPILGTCLSMGELRKLARKLDVVVKPGASDYELHAFFVRECRQETPLSSYVNKYLDKKFRKDLRLFAKASEETALAALWSHSVQSGDIPGPFWALMSHPDAGNLLLNKAFGEIHMLSHLMGAANRADLKRLGRLERRVDGLSQALSRVQAARRAQKLEGAVRVRELEEKLEAERTERLKLSRQMRETALPRQDLIAQPNADTLREQIEAARNETRRQAAIIEERYSENAALCEGGDGCPCPALAGKSVLYVGGRCNLVRHYREMVERQGLRFNHHDGGMESSPAELHGKLATADVVICPVDCVSHEACLTVKKACKHRMKPFVMLRSSGLSALARSLDQLGQVVN
ncbi:DUF2325 domain-containing protein [Fundidesulfovibrio terrae]|uniref:DUF2325 domain-containing protein n=1 Tax=Fundidesulfovibrio terrae TaxID=2922866 RepID=UPI001FAFDD60|nr:DUF2325 domain-containing protein [Fundidesulfovibrio terrae]